jgi:hypothetical protein
MAKRPSGLDRTLGRKSKPVPQHTRLLKPEEARRVGVSPTAKRRIRADIKRVTKHTRLYTDREVATAKIRRSTGRPKATRETYARERKARAQTETFIVVQPGGHYVDVTVQGSDIAKIRARNETMAEARVRQDGSRNLAPLNRFMRRYRRHYVTDVETGERVALIMSREELDRSKAHMNMRTREEVDKRYAEDMSEA